VCLAATRTYAYTTVGYAVKIPRSFTYVQKLSNAPTPSHAFHSRVSCEPVAAYCPHRLAAAGEHRPHITCAVYNHVGTEILASYSDDDLYVFDTAHSTGADALASFTGHRNAQTVKGCSWYGQRSEYVVSGSDCGHVFFWQRSSGRIVHHVYADEAGVVS
jgi:WD repeat-containing protein 42A